MYTKAAIDIQQNSTFITFTKAIQRNNDPQWSKLLHTQSNWRIVYLYLSPENHVIDSAKLMFELSMKTASPSCMSPNGYIYHLSNDF